MTKTDRAVVTIKRKKEIIVCLSFAIIISRLIAGRNRTGLLIFWPVCQRLIAIGWLEHIDSHVFTCSCRRLLPMLPTCRLDVDFARRPPTSCWCRPTGGPRSVGGRSLSLAHVSGTAFSLTLRLLRRWPSSGGGWRQNFFAAATMLLDCWPSFLL